MPLDLPGFYFDEAKNRYFPLSTKPRTPVPLPPLKTEQPPTRRRRQIPFAQESLRQSKSYAGASRAKHALWCAQIDSACRVSSTILPIFGNGTASSIKENRSLVGDDRGWLYSHNQPTNSWTPVFNLQQTSPVSSVSTCGEICVATSFGPSPKIYIEKSEVSLHRASLFTLTSLCDVRRSHLLNRSLVIAAGQKQVHFADLDVISFKTDCFESDVLALYQTNNLIYTGLRNGSTSRNDTRTTHTECLFPRGLSSSPVVHFEIFDDTQVVVSRMNGELATFDLRFPRGSTPNTVFEGHVNSYTENLGVAIDPLSHVLFAAGQDGIIRGWSMRSGKQTFAHRPGESLPLPSLHVIQDLEGLSLHAIQGRTLYSLHVGQSRFELFQHISLWMSH